MWHGEKCGVYGCKSNYLSEKKKKAAHSQTTATTTTTRSAETKTISSRISLSL